MYKHLVSDERTTQLRTELAMLIEKRADLLKPIYDGSNSTLLLDSADSCVLHAQAQRMQRQIEDIANRISEIESLNAVQANAQDDAAFGQPHHGHDDDL